MMQRRLRVPLALTILTVCLVSACGTKTVMDSYVLKDAYLAGDPSKGIKPVRNLILWPLANNSTGSKAKGVETKYYDIFVDKFYLEGVFDNIIIISPDRANDLMTRAGEELGLKRKPKDIDSGLVVSKVGQLAGGEAVFTGVIQDFDEDKTDKVTETVVGGTFYLVDAREKSYASLDSFTPMRYLWRTTVKQTSTETIAKNRASLDNMARLLVQTVVQTLVNNISGGTQSERKILEKRLADLKAKADDFADKEEFDKAIGVWNDVLKLDPASTEAKAKIEAMNTAKKEAEERKKAEALKKEIDGMKKEASSFEKEGNLAEAVAKWNAILEKDKGNKEATEKIEKLKARIEEEKERARQQEISKLLYQAQKGFDDKKYSDAIDGAKKVLELDPGNEKARAIVNDATLKIEEAKAKEQEAREKEAREKEAREKEAREAEKAKAAEKPRVQEEAVPAPEPPAAAEKPAEEKAPVAAEPEKPAAAAAPEKPVAPPEPEKPAAATAPEKPAAPREPEKPAAAVAEKKAGGRNAQAEEIRKNALGYFDKEEYQKSYDEWKKLLELVPDDAQAKEMLDTTEMLLKALQ